MARNKQEQDRQATDERSLRDELRPKDSSAGSAGVKTKGRDDEVDMPDGIGKKNPYEDYNPAGPSHGKTKDKSRDEPARH